MVNDSEDNSKENGLKIKTLIPCRLVYPYQGLGGIPKYHTCVEVFRHLTFFDFPSLPRDIIALLLLDVSKGSYEFGMNIVDENGNKLINEKMKKIDVPDENTSIDFIQSFQNVVFPKDGKYFFQFILDNEIIFKQDFMALKIIKRDLTSEEVENILEDPETIKATIGVLKCGCGHSKKFSLALNPEKQKEEEKLPDENIIDCEQCGKEINIAEMKANMRFYLGSKNLIDTFNRNLNESRILAANGFLNSSLIMQVSAFEAYMRDSFILNYKNWFFYLSDKNEDTDKNIKKIKEKMIKIIEQLKLKDQFNNQIFFMGFTDHKTELDEIDKYNNVLKTILFGDDEESNFVNKFISFQQLKDTFGSFWVYKHFFGIDIKNELDRQKDKYVEHLLNCFQIRHRIIHGSSKIEIHKREINTNLISKNEKIILFIRKFIKKEFKKIENKRKNK